MLTLLLHADRAPELKDTPGAKRIHYSQEDFGNLTYESLGKVVVPVSDEGADPMVYAECRMFAHPGLIAEIRENGERRVVKMGPLHV